MCPTFYFHSILGSSEIEVVGAMKPFIFVGILLLFGLASAFLPIDESDQGNKARIAYSLAKEVGTEINNVCIEKKSYSRHSL